MIKVLPSPITLVTNGSKLLILDEKYVHDIFFHFVFFFIVSGLLYLSVNTKQNRQFRESPEMLQKLRTNIKQLKTEDVNISTFCLKYVRVQNATGILSLLHRV